MTQFDHSCRIFTSMRARLISFTSGFLLVMFVFNTCVFGLFLSARLHFHQYAQHSQQKSKKPIIELRIPAQLVESRNDEFVWVKDWEFRYHGEMYDIERSTKAGSEWIFACKHDTKEDKIRKQIERENKHQNEQRDCRSKKNIKVVTEYFAQNSFLFVPETSEVEVIVAYVSAIRISHRSIPDPPPWFV